MSNVAKLKKKAAEFELKRQFDKALAIYIELLDNYDANPLEVDVALFNRVGDMLLRQGNVADAVDYYERAVDKYAEGGFFNNAIALCNKILRQSPGRASIYYKLGKISAQKGFKSDAKQNFLEYADRMQKSGRMDEAFRALKEFADLCPDQDDIRLMLADQLSRQARGNEALEQLQTLFDRYSSDGRDAEARATLDRIRAIDPGYEPRVTGQQAAQKSSDLIFLDVYGDSTPAPAPSKPAPPPAPPSAPAPRVATAPPIDAFEPPPLDAAPPPTSAQLGGLETTSFEPSAGSMDGPALDLEPTSFQTGAQGAAPPRAAGGMLEGLEATSFDLPAASPAEPPFLQDFGLGATEIPAAEPVQPGTEASVFEVPAADADGVEDFPLLELDIPTLPSAGGGLRPTGDIPLISAVDDGIDQGQAFADAWAAGAEDQAPIVADAGLRTSDSGAATIDLPPFGDVAPPAPAAAPSGDRTRSSTIAAEQSVARLEAESLAHPDDLLLRRQLGEARLDSGDREGGVADLEAVMSGLERAEDLAGAASLANEIARLMPDSVRIQQKRVEYAFRTNDRRHLVAAYLDLAAALLGDGQSEKARTVYKRVLDLAPDDIAAQAGLAALTPEPEAEAMPPATAARPEARPTPAAAPPARPAAPPAAASLRGFTAPTPSQGTAAQRDRVWTVPAKPVHEDEGALVNLGDWLRDEEAPKSTRMVVEEREPTGDEEADFAEMLRRFKQGVAENVDAEDHQAHYDLGVAFKEMGLVDEAIAEFQKALRAPSNRLPTYEALGQCFVDKEQYPVAQAILGRALNENGATDEQLIGVLYLLGRAAEGAGKYEEASGYYQRVFVIDIQFRDVAERLNAVEQTRR